VGSEISPWGMMGNVENTNNPYGKGSWPFLISEIPHFRFMSSWGIDLN
jgi:hypothetical protein